MTKKILRLAMLVMILVLGMAVVGCKRGEKGAESAAKSSEGILTINNCPAGPSVLVCENSSAETMLELTDALSNFYAAAMGDESPFTLYTTSGKKFTETGKYLVTVTVDLVVYFAENISFDNGCATVDFKNMKALTDLPPM